MKEQIKAFLNRLDDKKLNEPTDGEASAILIGAIMLGIGACVVFGFGATLVTVGALLIIGALCAITRRAMK
jgi:hypothetical protein